MKIKCFSKRKLNMRISKTKIKCAILGFSQNCCILGKSREKLVKFIKNSAKIQQILANFATLCKNQQKIQQFLTKKLRLEDMCHMHSCSISTFATFHFLNVYFRIFLHPDGSHENGAKECIV